MALILKGGWTVEFISMFYICFLSLAFTEEKNIQIIIEDNHIGKRSELRKSQRRKPKRTPKTP
jgi:hypothetical protein